MKKILVSIFLLVFGLCLVGCEKTHIDLNDDIVIDGKYYAEVIYNNPLLSHRAFSRKITIENNKIEEYEFLEYELKGEFFAFVPEAHIDIFEPIMNIEKIWFAEIMQPEDIESEIGFYLTLSNSNFYLYYGSYKDNRGYIINSAYKLIRLDMSKYDCENNEHFWDEGVVDPSSSLSNPPIKYTCLLCGVTKKEPTEWLEHSHEYIDGLCDCGEFDNVWLNENFRLSDEQILFKGSVEDEFNCDVIILTLKHTTTYIELSKRHFKLDEITKVVYISSTPPSHFYEPDNEDMLNNFHQIVFLYVDVETKEEIIELIIELEKLPFVESVGPNSIEHGE